MQTLSRLLLILGFACHLSLPALAEDLAESTDSTEEVLAGHSNHGEAFNEGPRQAAYLMPNMGNVHLAASTENVRAQKFIDQGVAQLHGFWYYEAERSFRQAAVLDPDCALAYWGMAQANTGNMVRARGFIAEAIERLEGVTRQEELLIKAYEKFCQEKDGDKKISKKDRAKKYTLDLEEIVLEFPDDVEAKALLALQLWQNSRADMPIVSHVAINSILDDVFEANPKHPAHHYRIHLWDRHNPKIALESAAKCGPSLPGVAHMWHMPGHIYDKLHRYNDAAWQQEASARVDHSHMIRDRVMPDQIHNFAHNNEWLIRSLLKVGRVSDALSLAKNMLELPRHPKYNTPKRGSARYGRQRLWMVLSSYRLWDEMVGLSDSMYFETGDDIDLELEKLGNLGFAHAMLGNEEQSNQFIASIEKVIADDEAQLNEIEESLAAAKEREGKEKIAKEKEKEKQAKQEDSDENDVDAKGVDAKDADEVAKSEQEATQEDTSKSTDTASTDDEEEPKKTKKELESEKKKLKKRIEAAKKKLASVKVGLAAREKDWESVEEKLKKADIKDILLKAEWKLAGGDSKAAIEMLEKEVKDKPGQLPPLSTLAFVQYSAEGVEAAKETFEKVRELAAHADLSTPMLSRLDPLASDLGIKGNWANEAVAAEDLGDRPELGSLGPFRWEPYVAPTFTVESAAGDILSNSDLNGRPTVVIFYLGFGCLHCVEQLHEFSPKAKEFREQGIEVLAISTENLASLNKGMSEYSEPIQMTLHSDSELKAFKDFRCFDDFEEVPLHGTFLLDPAGRVLWQDISYEPFMDVDFLLGESKRLLGLSGYELPQAEQLTSTDVDEDVENTDSQQ